MAFALIESGVCLRFQLGWCDFLFHCRSIWLIHYWDVGRSIHGLLRSKFTQLVEHLVCSSVGVIEVWEVEVECDWSAHGLSLAVAASHTQKIFRAISVGSAPDGCVIEITHSRFSPSRWWGVEREGRG